jgi:hypothetical protein
LSPQSGPKRTLMIQIVVTNRDFMSTRQVTDRAKKAWYHSSIA